MRCLGFSKPVVNAKKDELTLNRTPSIKVWPRPLIFLQADTHFLYSDGISSHPERMTSHNSHFQTINTSISEITDVSNLIMS